MKPIDMVDVGMFVGSGIGVILGQSILFILGMPTNDPIVALVIWLFMSAVLFSARRVYNRLNDPLADHLD